MAIETTKWGILYCPKAGISNKRKRWEKIQKVLDERQVAYDFVQSETADSVERLMKMMISNGYKTIIIVGGDSALNDAVNCLMMEEKEVRESIALGVIPNGLMNDFARFWDIDESRVEENVDSLIKRRIRKVDLGCIRYTNAKSEKCHRYFLNCVNVGMTADIMNLRRQTRRLLGSRTLSFISSLFVMLFHRMEYKMKLLDVSVVYHPEVVQLIEGLWLLITGRSLNHRSVHPFRTKEVRVEYAKHAMVGIDGRLMKTPVGPFVVNVEQEVINFLIPQ